MKKIVIYIFLLAYSVFLLKPLLPYVADACAHAFWYSSHMATVHYVNGKFHVHKEVMEESKKTNNNSPLAEKKDQQQNDHLPVNPSHLSAFSASAVSIYAQLNTNLLPAYSNTTYPPPKI